MQELSLDSTILDFFFLENNYCLCLSNCIKSCILVAVYNFNLDFVQRERDTINYEITVSRSYFDHT